MTIRNLQCFSRQKEEELIQWLSQRGWIDPSLQDKVSQIVDRVEKDGDSALVDYSRQFDCPDFTREMIGVPIDRIQGARDRIDPEDKALIEEAIHNIHSFHSHQKRTSWFVSPNQGLITGQLHRPLDSAGMYIPGGRSGDTPLISSLLMNVIPAQIAGVNRICLTSPPGSDGELNPYTLASADLLGIREIYAVGSAWAVAALALGTETVPQVDMISGPGNVFVTLAKKLLYGRVGIDMLAGPSEILILADTTADPAFLASDLLSQAEHDEDSCAMLFSPNPELLQRVEIELKRQLENLPRAQTAKNSLSRWGGLVLVPDVESGISLINRIAPEHLQLCLQSPWDWIDSVRNAGTLFLGSATPEPLGDYFAGPNHVLPTVGTARFASGLGVDSFCKRTNLVSATPDYIQRNADSISRLARLEGLEAHARSALLRSEGKDRANSKD